MNKKVALHNLGCKVNAYEVEAMQQLLEKAGYEIVPFTEKADVYVITPVQLQILLTENHVRCCIKQKK